MSEQNVTRSELADRAGFSKARVTQILSNEANPTLKSMARLFFALGEQPCVSRKRLESAKAMASHTKDRPQEWQWGQTLADAHTHNEGTIRTLKKELARDIGVSNDNHAPVLFLPSEMALVPEPEAAYGGPPTPFCPSTCARHCLTRSRLRPG
ncbi:helix-turn-helix domain-containing protein [Bradyrhizobium tropiciagri]|uniref:helix-turn-helix domain-containing protein n=1 Tax=Bradyrhizobium tropiciagri TaxID=312253 RepID=UPI003D9B3DE9